MASTTGRRVVLPLTNKSGGAVAAGDVVIIDTGNNESFTTTTTGAYTGMAGIAQEAIANNATGRVLMSGYAALVNVNASVTRGNFGLTHTVAKQATDGGASRITGAFCQFLTGGATPTAHVFAMPDGSSASGNVATDPIWDASGDLVQGTGSNTAAKLTKGPTGTVPTAGASSLAYAYPPCYEFDYVQKTSNSSITGTSAGAANTLVTGAAVTYDGSTAVMIEFFSAFMTPDTGASGRDITIGIFEGSTEVGRVGYLAGVVTGPVYGVVHGALRLTPTAGSHTYIAKAWVSAGTGTVGGGAAGAAAGPMFMRITKV
jgi:Uncharacterized conserved protein (DUF2190)